jgi:hypothetical protein
MKLSRNRIDDAPELDVHSSRFVTVTASRVCAGAWFAPVHGRTSMIPWCRSGGSASVNAARGADRSQSIDDTIVQ